MYRAPFTPNHKASLYPKPIKPRFTLSSLSINLCIWGRGQALQHNPLYRLSHGHLGFLNRSYSLILFNTSKTLSFALLLLPRSGLLQGSEGSGSVHIGCNRIAHGGLFGIGGRIRSDLSTATDSPTWFRSGSVHSSGNTYTRNPSLISTAQIAFPSTVGLPHKAQYQLPLP